MDRGVWYWALLGGGDGWISGVWGPVAPHGSGRVGVYLLYSFEVGFAVLVGVLSRVFRG